ncbi:Uncharacterised protein [Mycobacterium tuberculosis]|nr:Uncharacterised protein [Mycobacterium tuberculosis]CKT41231.1 Uncharacterised protein [Mycobacterium tuberculosis]CKT48110.1 Uncharacterised protein [Mycobacterium tuberculosis]
MRRSRTGAKEPTAAGAAKPAELRVAGVMTLPATASTYSDTGSDAIT